MGSKNAWMRKFELVSDKSIEADRVARLARLAAMSRHPAGKGRVVAVDDEVAE